MLPGNGRERRQGGAPASDLAAHIGHTIRVAGTLHNGDILASKAEMDNNGSSAEVKLSGMM